VAEILYICTTKDEFELPVAVAGSISELAKMLGKSEGGIRNTMFESRKNNRNCCYKKVIVEER
jgi:hypothetical protein